MASPTASLDRDVCIQIWRRAAPAHNDERRGAFCPIDRRAESATCAPLYAALPRRRTTIRSGHLAAAGALLEIIAFCPLAAASR